MVAYHQGGRHQGAVEQQGRGTRKILGKIALKRAWALQAAVMLRDDEIEFWFSIGSTYTYLAVSRLGQVEAARSVRFRWRPFSVLSLMCEMNNIPFSTKPAKAAYMWRDIERRASLYGLSIRL